MSNGKKHSQCSSCTKTDNDVSNIPVILGTSYTVSQKKACLHPRIFVMSLLPQEQNFPNLLTKNISTYHTHINDKILEHLSILQNTQIKNQYHLLSKAKSDKPSDPKNSSKTLQISQKITMSIYHKKPKQ